MTVFLPDSIRDLRLFVAVYEERSFTAAALRHNATQSGVSQHIRKIEGRLGVNLFSRDGGVVMPTPAGDMFYRTCIELLQSLDEARRKLERFEGKVSGDLMLGVTPTVARSVLAPALSRFVEDFPNANVRIVEGYSDAIVEAVKLGTLDFAAVPGLPLTPGIRSRVFGKTDEVFVTGLRGVQPDRVPISLDKMAPMKLVLPSKAQFRRASLDRYLGLTGARIERIMDVDSMFTTLDFVSGTDWATILPAILIQRDLDGSRFKINPFAERPLLLDLAIVESAQKPLSTLAASFFGYLEEETRNIARLFAEKIGAA